MTRAPLKLRPVDECDSILLWNWANDPVTRQSAFTNHTIPWDEHQAWFQAKLKDQECLQFIALDDQDDPVGQVRFDIRGREAEIDVSIDCSKRNWGYGSHLIALGVQQVAGESRVDLIHAYIKVENLASVQAFSRAGFVKVEPTIIKGAACEHLIYRTQG